MITGCHGGHSHWDRHPDKDACFAFLDVDDHCYDSPHLTIYYRGRWIIRLLTDEPQVQIKIN